MNDDDDDDDDEEFPFIRVESGRVVEKVHVIKLKVRRQVEQRRW